jgi:prepilin-type N-terminal cleavage/methylation domain-containing protein
MNEGNQREIFAKSSCTSAIDSTLSVRYLRRHGFTLVELLVVIAIIALLLAVLMPALRGARDQARTMVCGSNMRQYGIGLVMYTNDNSRFPSYCDLTGIPAGQSSSPGTVDHTVWYNLIAPYMGGVAVNAGDTRAVKIDKSAKNLAMKFRKCPTYTKSGPVGRTAVGVHYGGFSNNGSSGPFCYILRPDAPPVKWGSIRQPSTLIGFLDTQEWAGSLMYSPTYLPYDYDGDKDGIKDTCRGTGYTYNCGAPKVHPKGGPVTLLDGHVVRFPFKDWANVNHDYWYDKGLGRTGAEEESPY